MTELMSKIISEITNVNGNGVYDYGDDVYLNVPAGVSKGIVTVNNVRLSGPIL